MNLHIWLELILLHFRSKTTNKNIRIFQLKTVRTAKLNPFKHETVRERKKRLRHKDRDLLSRQTIESLKTGNFRPPAILPKSTNLANFRPYGDVEQDDSQLEGPSGDSMASPDLNSVWDSIPWDVIAPSTVPKPFGGLRLDPTITAAIREHDRNNFHHSRVNHWDQCMSKLFSSYLWLKEKTRNWTATCSFDSFTSKFCKCNDDTPRFNQFVDLVDNTGQ
ncbi:hypothetical protein PtA15_5A83 [Puccinia triticina]|uniref:CxC1-like cysteine cluster associated with KDZ transposases domain-containing protein n=1 Tax=Puccinia triticina TaxID=208348 RepID=A0ABY7CHW9_9BASI|nr:uncharacterized protein PtA15_5A83 [Puccinia triticina]WAQ84513.1 hypothetical protein PtA15_5A83 [Puccinia triticina]